MMKEGYLVKVFKQRIIVANIYARERGAAYTQEF